MVSEQYDVVYRRQSGVGVAVIRRNGEDLLVWIPDQNFSGSDGHPITRSQCPGIWEIVDVLRHSNHPRNDDRDLDGPHPLGPSSWED